MAKPPVTSPAPKYGPTAAFGRCEAPQCKANARAECTTCEGHFCLGHVDHQEHAAAR